MRKKHTPRNRRKSKLYDSNKNNRKGACCMGNGNCKSKLKKNECDALSGTWMGSGTYCPEDFPQPNNGVKCFINIDGESINKTVKNKNKKMGSCCYYDEKDNRAKCKDGMSFYQCKEKNKGNENHWSAGNLCNQRISAKQDLCCNTCGRKSKDINVRKIMNNIKKSSRTFRSRVNEKTNEVSFNAQEKCRISVNKTNLDLIKSISYDASAISVNEAKDVCNLIKIVGLERCETCEKTTSEKMTASLRSYYGCLCRSNKEKEQELISAFNKFKQSMIGTETNQDELILHKEIDKIIEKYKIEEDNCNSLIDNDNTPKGISEKEEGCCCQYTKNKNTLKRCSSLTRRQCSKIRKYRTRWLNCSEPGCDKTCVAGNQAGKCSSCPGYANQPRRSPQASGPQDSSPSSAPSSSPASSPSSSPSPPPTSSPSPPSSGGY